MAKDKPSFFGRREENPDADGETSTAKENTDAAGGTGTAKEKPKGLLETLMGKIRLKPMFDHTQLVDEQENE